MYNSQMKSENFTGDYALKSFDLTIQNNTGTTFEITLQFDVFNLDVFEKDSDSGLYYLANLNSRLKLEFGWGNYMWDYENSKTISKTKSHSGKGQELYCAVADSNVNIGNDQVITFTVTLISPASLILKNWPNDFRFNLNFDKLKTDVTYFTKNSIMG